MTMFLNSTADINAAVNYVNNLNTQYPGTDGKGIINPTTFYSKQLLDTIRMDADQYVYYRLADTSPIGDKADKLQIRRWAPLQAHTTPLEEGIPPQSDKGSVEKYEITAFQYGRFMEFTDKVNFTIVDPVIAHYTREYAIVAIETCDLLARECLFSIANPWYAKYSGTTAPTDVDDDSEAAFRPKSFANLRPVCVPNMTDLRKIVLSMKKQLVKPRSNGRYHVIGSPEFYYDMLSDPTVENYMKINQSTKTMYDNGQLVPMFGMEFYETLCVPTSGEYTASDGHKSILIYSPTLEVYRVLSSDKKVPAFNGAAGSEAKISVAKAGYTVDARTGQSASYIPSYIDWDGAVAAINAIEATTAASSGYVNNTEDGVSAVNETTNPAATDWEIFKVQHILIAGAEVLTRTGLQGEDQVKTYVKAAGSAGVLDPIDQRQSIGFKINSLGFGSTRLEAAVDYICVPSTLNI